jgi:hypothetical protein
MTERCMWCGKVVWENERVRVEAWPFYDLPDGVMHAGCLVEGVEQEREERELAEKDVNLRRLMEGRDPR